MLKIKRILRRIFKILFGLVAIAFCLVFVVCAVFGIKGYFMYRDAIDQVPITEKVESIRSREGFTTYEELPQIYKDAVISVEDHRFLSHNGIDIIAIGRALLNEMCIRDSRHAKFLYCCESLFAPQCPSLPARLKGTYPLWNDCRSRFS